MPSSVHKRKNEKYADYYTNQLPIQYSQPENKYKEPELICYFVV